MTLNDVVHKIVDTYDVEDHNGNVISPKVVFVDNKGREFTLKDVYITGDDKCKFVLEEKNG